MAMDEWISRSRLVGWFLYCFVRFLRTDTFVVNYLGMVVDVPALSAATPAGVTARRLFYPGWTVSNCSLCVRNGSRYPAPFGPSPIPLFDRYMLPVKGDCYAFRRGAWRSMIDLCQCVASLASLHMISATDISALSHL